MSTCARYLIAGPLAAANATVTYIDAMSRPILAALLLCCLAPIVARGQGSERMTLLYPGPN